MPSGTDAVTARDKQSAQLRERAKRLLIQKRFQRAVEVCNEALKLTPGNYKVLRIRSTAWCQIGEYHKSLADADVVLQAVPYSSDAWYQKGYSHFHLKDYMAAAHAFAQGLEHNGADRTLQHGFTDALTLMARIKAVHDPARQSSSSPDASTAGQPQPAPAEAATLAELLPHLPAPSDEDPEFPDETSSSKQAAQDGKTLDIMEARVCENGENEEVGGGGSAAVEGQVGNEAVEAQLGGNGMPAEDVLGDRETVEAELEADGAAEELEADNSAAAENVADQGRGEEAVDDTGIGNAADPAEAAAAAEADGLA